MKTENEDVIIAYLAEIKRLSEDIKDENKKYNEAIETFAADYMKCMDALNKALDKARKELISHLKKNRADIFPGKTDRVSVTGGIVIRQIKKAVRKAKHITVEFLKEKGKSHAVKIEESVNWGEINTWSDDELSEIETDRKAKNKFEFELSEK